MKIQTLFILLLASFVGITQLNAQRKVLGISKVKISPSVQLAAKQDGAELSLMRVSEAIDGQLIDSINSTRKFEIIARSDLDALLEEGGFTGEGLQVGSSDYLVVPSIDDFQDFVEKATFSGIGATAEKRKIRLGMVAKIYDSKAGTLLESANFQLDNKFVEKLLSNSSRTGSFSDELLRKIAEEMGSKISKRVVDVVYPAKVIMISGSQVTINRGDGTDIKSGQIWSIYTAGEELIDPDTGESLGSNEVNIGKVQIDRVTPKFSTAKIIEDYGIERGSIARHSN